MTSETNTTGYTQARVEIVENPRVTARRGRPPRSPEAFIARNEGAKDSTVETDSSGVTTTHNRPGTLVMYKPSETQGYVARRVSASAIRVLLQQGWSEYCPDCNGEHRDRNGNITTDPNACSARPSTAVRVCPVCQKRIYDNQGMPKQPEQAYDDPNVIPDDGVISTPESRTRILLDLHLWAKHPRQAQMMGRPALPTALQEIAQSVQASVS